MKFEGRIVHAFPRMIALSGIVAATLVLAACQPRPVGSSIEEERALTFRGVGPVRLGMTFAQAEQALGAKLSTRQGMETNRVRLD